MTEGEADFSDGSLDDPQVYPREYTHSYEVWVVGIAGISLMGCMLVALGFSLATLFLLAPGFAFFVYELLSYYRYRLVLEYDKVEITKPFSRRSIRRDAIAGKRIIHIPVPAGASDPRPAARIILVPKDANVRPLKFTLTMETDEVID